MTHERYVELMNREIDGLNVESESQALRDYLNTDQSARKYYEDLVRTARNLSQMEEIQPPPYLKAHILNSIEFKSVPAQTIGGWATKILQPFQLSTMPRFALVFATGLAVGILILVFATPLRDGGTPDEASLSGSMLFAPDFARFQKIDSAEIDREGIAASLKTFRSGDNVLLDLSIKSDEKTNIELRCKPQELVFAGMRRMTGSGGSISVSEGRVLLTDLQSNHSFVTFSVAEGAQPFIEGRVYRGDRQIQSFVLQTH